MCGIGGVFSDEISFDEKREIAKTMAISMHHRGPDASSVYMDENLALAATRLTIVDTHCEDAMIWNENKSSVIAFNGEIYNFSELRKELLKKYNFQTKTDTEVVLHLIEEYGTNGIHYLNGDFAFFFWDTDRLEGILARDGIGVKPLYYASIGKTLVFASEIKPLLICFPELDQIDNNAVYDYLTFRYVPGPRTVFKNIRKLEPGSYITINKMGYKIEKHWEIKSTDSNSNLLEEKNIIELGRNILKQSVIDRMPNEVNYGILLSGGLDSSLITAIVSNNVQQNLNTFSVIYDVNNYKDISEHEYSRRVANIFKTNHTELLVTAEMFQRASLDAIYFMEEPVADPPAALLSLICEVSHQSVKVLLSGEGADELQAGYYVYLDMLKNREIYTGMGRLLTGEDKLSLLSEDFRYSIERQVLNYYISQPLEGSNPDVSRRLNDMLITDMKYWLPDDLLLKADKMGMRSSVEIRVPFLDKRFVDFSFALPPELKIKNSTQKYLLRRMAEVYLPTEITEQVKKGFPLPLGAWLRGPLQNWIKEIILSQLTKRMYFDKTKLEKFLSNYFDSPPSRFLDHVIWSFLVLELFHSEVIDRFHK